MTDPSGHIGCLFDAHFICCLNLLLIITTILSEFPLTHRCASYTHKKWKGNTVFCQSVSLGGTKTGSGWPKICDHHGMSFQPLFCHLLGHGNAKEFIRYCQARKPEKRKPESDTDQGDDTQGKKHKLCPKWLGELRWLKYDSTEKQMKWKVCLDAYGWKPNPSQNFLHWANNLVLILASLLNTITFKFL